MRIAVLRGDRAGRGEGRAGPRRGAAAREVRTPNLNRAGGRARRRHHRRRLREGRRAGCTPPGPRRSPAPSSGRGSAGPPRRRSARPRRESPWSRCWGWTRSMRSCRRSPRGSSPSSPSSACRASPAPSRWTCSRRRPRSPATRRCSSARRALPKFLPMLTTAAGTLAPAQGVRHRRRRGRAPGHRHRAPARRAWSPAFDVRPAAREQVLSLGATFVGPELVGAECEAAGGYARDPDRRGAGASTRDALAAARARQDLVITTAQMPGRDGADAHHGRDGRQHAPGLGDGGPRGGDGRQLRADARPARRWRSDGVTILGPVQLAATVPLPRQPDVRPQRAHPGAASLTKEGALKLDPDGRDHRRDARHARTGRSPGGTADRVTS